MRHLLRDGHHAFPRAELRVGFLQNARGPGEEILAGEELGSEIVGFAHG
jgi:hypothetical protein